MNSHLDPSNVLLSILLMLGFIAGALAFFALLARGNRR